MPRVLDVGQPLHQAPRPRYETAISVHINQHVLKRAFPGPRGAADRFSWLPEQTAFAYLPVKDPFVQMNSNHKDLAHASPPGHSKVMLFFAFNKTSLLGSPNPKLIEGADSLQRGRWSWVGKTETIPLRAYTNTSYVQVAGGGILRSWELGQNTISLTLSGSGDAWDMKRATAGAKLRPNWGGDRDSGRIRKQLGATMRGCRNGGEPQRTEG